MAKARDYKAEYERYHSKPEQRKNRSLRVLARRKMAKELGESAISGKDIDHKRPLSKGGTNARGNLRVVSVHKNRGRK